MIEHEFTEYEFTEELSLKWGTLKSWSLNKDGPAYLFLQKLELSMSAMMNKHNDEERKIICDIIDALDNDKIYLDWDGVYVNKEKAKKYIMNYENLTQSDYDDLKQS